MNKTMLATAVAGLLISANAGAVTLGANSITYASEIANGTVIANNVDNIDFTLGYNFSGGEVRYGRFECSSNVKLTNATVSEASPNIALGQINGQGTQAIFFSITATDPLVADDGNPANGVEPATSGVPLSMAADFQLLDKNNVSCAFSIYDQPSQAQAGGTVGRIYSTELQTVFKRDTGVVFSSAGGTAVADVSTAAGAYYNFVGGVNDFGTLAFVRNEGVLDVDGQQIDLADIYKVGTKVNVLGDFTAANTVAWGEGTATPTATAAVFDIPGADDAGNNGENSTLKFFAKGNVEIPAATYSANVTQVFNTGYEKVRDLSLAYVGEIKRNGVEIQAPLVQVTPGYVSRISLTNTGAVARKFTMRVINEAGNTIGTDSTMTTGTIPQNGQTIVDLTQVIKTYATTPRAAVIVTVDAPNNTIQGLYQIVNPANGSISNETMVRPGTN